MSEQATETGPLTVDAAIASLLPPEPVEEQAQEAPVEAAEGEEPQGETSAPEEADAEPVEPAEGDEAEAEPEPVVAAEPPKYWSQDAKAQFAALPPEMQAVVLAQEGPREEATAKAKAEAAQIREAAQKEIQGVQALVEHLNTFIPDAVQTFQTQWGAEEPDWEAVIGEHGAEAAALFQARYHKERNLLLKTIQARDEAAVTARKAELASELASLNEMDPELAPDPEDMSKGAEKRGQVSNYLKSQGFTEQVVDLISARELVIAKKAMLWDHAQAALKARPPTPAPAAPAARSPVRPAATPAQSSTQRTATQVANRFAQTRSVDDAVALLLARKA